MMSVCCGWKPVAHLGGSLYEGVSLVAPAPHQLAGSLLAHMQPSPNALVKANGMLWGSGKSTVEHNSIECVSVSIPTRTLAGSAMNQSRVILKPASDPLCIRAVYSSTQPGLILESTPDNS